MISNFQFISLKDVYGINASSLTEFIRHGSVSTENDKNFSAKNDKDVLKQNDENISIKDDAYWTKKIILTENDENDSIKNEEDLLKEND